MIYSSIDLAYTYDDKSAAFKAAYDFLHRPGLEDLPPGPIVINDAVKALVQEYETRPGEAIAFESHNKMADIQYVVSGCELFGVAPRKSLVEKTPYNDEADASLYQDPKQCTWVLLQAGDFITVFPEDAHKPQVQAEAGKACRVKKIVMKVRL
jgi:YhcH/YjgK/YiaL family protein